MAQQNRTTLKGYFNTGDIPTESQFADLIDSAHNISEDGDVATDLSDHEADTSNPHSVTKTQVGLGNADNTSDANKPISDAQATVNALKEDKPVSLVISSDTPSLQFNAHKISSSAYTPSSNFVPTLAGSGNVIGNIISFELVLDGIKTVTFPSVVYSNNFTNGEAPANGTYTFMLMYWSGGVWVIMSEVKITDPVAPSNLQLSENTIDENNSINDVVGILSANGGGSMIFSLVAGTDDTDNSSFNISGSNLRASEVFDFETKSSYSIRVEADNGVNPPVEAQFTITINDVSESSLTFTALTVKYNTNIDEDFDGNGITGTKNGGVDFGAWVTFEEFLDQDQDGYIKVQYPDNTPRGMIMGANSIDENAGKLNYEYAGMIATSSNAVQPRFNDNLVSPADNPTNIATDQWVILGRESGVWKIWVAEDEDNDPANWILVHDFPIPDQSPHYLGITLYQDSDNYFYPEGAQLTEPVDEDAPVATWNPLDEATDFAANGNIVITFNEAIRNTDTTEITNENVDNLITLKEDNESGANITFDATINAGKTQITINPTEDFDFEQVVYVAIAAVEDVLGNETSGENITFTVESAPSGVSFVDMTVLDDVNIDITTPTEGLLLEKNGGSNFGAYCRFNEVVPSSGDVYVKMQYGNTDARGTIIGFNVADELTDYTTYEFAMMFATSSDQIEGRLNGSAITEDNTINASIGQWAVIGRQSGIIKIWRANNEDDDPSNWTLVHTFAGTHNQVMYIGCTIYLDTRNCYYPQSVGMTTR